MTTQAVENYTEIRDSLAESGLFDAQGETGGNTWRISLDAYGLTRQEVAFFEDLGGHLLKFYSALNRFYLDSARGKLPTWFAEYLDQGKPRELIDHGRMKRFKSLLPGIIRPDVIVTEGGFQVTELDAVPGGFGLTARLMDIYRNDGQELVGGDLPRLFYRMMESAAGTPGARVAIVVSDEASDYLSEMQYLASRLRDEGAPVFVCRPEEILFREEGLFVAEAGEELPLDAVYRFYELFDLRNIPKAELLMYANKKGRVATTPPYKPWLEEKLAFALFHHPVWRKHWENALGSETFTVLTHLIPKTWILDNRELPPYGVIPGLSAGGAPVGSWRELHGLTQKERELVIKPSGFSPDAWGSRGVVVGHDVSSEEWIATLEDGLRRFPERPCILQEFHKGRQVEAAFVNPATGLLERMKSRVRLTPYYFTVDGAARLGGVLATLCPANKKKIHGMVDAIMVPCAVREKQDNPGLLGG